MRWFNNLIAQTLPLVPKPIVRRVSSRYIAGETVEDALATVRSLNGGGMMATLDVLGEDVTRESEARQAGAEYRALLNHIAESDATSNVSMKLTQLGLKIDPELCHEIVLSVVKEAVRLGNFIRIDMEDSSCTDETLRVFGRIHDQYPEQVGIVIQAYLKRSLEDVRALVRRRANVRLCKGIYIESPKIAYRDYQGINDNFNLLLAELLRGGCYVGIATHDRPLVEAAYGLIDEMGLTPDQYEFQMLLGVTEGLRAQILERGHRLRVYVGYGPHWYAYSVRRLKENPAMAGHILKGMFNGNK
jgi:proline dehydrogenase